VEDNELPQRFERRAAGLVYEDPLVDSLAHCEEFEHWRWIAEGPDFAEKPIVAGFKAVMTGELANHSLRCEITPNVLRSPDGFVDYLASMASQTVSLIRQFEDLGSGRLRSLVEQPVEEY
jgi:hypothetical protein